jgi:hypothetical protein
MSLTPVANADGAVGKYGYKNETVLPGRLAPYLPATDSANAACGPLQVAAAGLQAFRVEFTPHIAQILCDAASQQFQLYAVMFRTESSVDR